MLAGARFPLRLRLFNICYANESRFPSVLHSTFSSQRMLANHGESDATKEELIRNIMKKLKGPLADENGNIPTGANRPVAIEVDGPSHFYVNSTKYTAYTKLKHRLLTRMGYKVLHVPYFEWKKLKGPRDRENYLKEKMKEEPTEWLEPEDEKLYAERAKHAQEMVSAKPPPPKGPRPSSRRTPKP